jgi:hypothetical protein
MASSKLAGATRRLRRISGIAALPATIAERLPGHLLQAGIRAALDAILILVVALAVARPLAVVMAAPVGRIGAILARLALRVVLILTALNGCVLIVRVALLVPAPIGIVPPPPKPPDVLTQHSLGSTVLHPSTSLPIRKGATAA